MQLTASHSYLPATVVRHSPSTSSPSPGAHSRSPCGSSPDGNHLRDFDQWLYSDREVRKSPSLAIGISWDEEKEMRKKGCIFLQQVGYLLRLPQVAIATAAVFFHRFYMRKPLKEYHHYSIAATCLFLAAKVEETARKLRDVAYYCIQKANKAHNQLKPSDWDRELHKWKEAILVFEEVILEAITFDLTLHHPYQVLLDASSTLKLERPLIQQTWSIINDSLRTVMCLRYPSSTIAAASLSLACKVYNQKLPTTPDGRDIWEHFGTTGAEVQEAATTQLDFYLRKDTPGSLRKENEEEDSKKRQREASASGPNPKRQQISLSEYRSRNNTAQKGSNVSGGHDQSFQKESPVVGKPVEMKNSPGIPLAEIKKEDRESKSSLESGELDNSNSTTALPNGIEKPSDRSLHSIGDDRRQHQTDNHHQGQDHDRNGYLASPRSVGHSTGDSTIKKESPPTSRAAAHGGSAIQEADKVSNKGRSQPSDDFAKEEEVSQTFGESGDGSTEDGELAA